MPVGEDSRADVDGGDPRDAVAGGADDELGGASADVGHAHRAHGRPVQRADDAGEGEVPLLFGRQDLDGHAGGALGRGGQGLAVRRRAQRGGRDDTERLGTERPGTRRLGAHDGGQRRGSGRVGVAEAQVHEPPLRGHLPEPCVRRLRDEQPRRVGADVDAGAAQGLHHLCS